MVLRQVRINNYQHQQPPRRYTMAKDDVNRYNHACTCSTVGLLAEEFHNEDQSNENRSRRYCCK